MEDYFFNYYSGVDWHLKVVEKENLKNMFAKTDENMETCRNKGIFCSSQVARTIKIWDFIC